MDILDNLMYASFARGMGQIFTPGFPASPNIDSDFVPDLTIPNPLPNGLVGDQVYSYSGLTIKNDFCSFVDSNIIENSLKRHWFDIHAGASYRSNGLNAGGDLYTDFSKSSTYHLIAAYLIENTRIIQIFQRMLEIYFSSEELGIAENEKAFNWIHNTEALLFRNDSLGASTLSSNLRTNSNHIRRNAYWRMFGMDLAFEDITSPETKYIKPQISNQQFIAVFEKYLSEIWQSYTNANNSSGVNTTDLNIIIDLCVQLKELLSARRGSSSQFTNSNLSREEYQATFINSWFTYIISFDSEIVKFLHCQSSTIGERLIKIGNKVGIPAHLKCQSLFEMAGACGNILRKIEDGNILDDQTRMQLIIKSLLSGPPTNDQDKNIMIDLLTIINNWEKATGHNIKNPSANIRGTVSLQQNGPVKPQLNGTMPKPALN